jgi:signal transduction histidine kinase
MNQMLANAMRTLSAVVPGPIGSGLVGLADRLAALDGRLRVESAADGGTLIAAAIPIAGQLPQLWR